MKTDFDKMIDDECKDFELIDEPHAFNDMDDNADYIDEPYLDDWRYHCGTLSC